MIGSRFGHADAVILSDYQGKIEYDNQLLMITFTAITDDGLFDIMAIYPFKALVNKVLFERNRPAGMIKKSC